MHGSLAAAVLMFAVAKPAFAEESVRERIEWADIWVTDADKDELPRVLLIGDSITRGYFGDVEKALTGKASCARLTTSKCVCDPSFADEVHLLLKQYRFAVIHFNNGLHGWGYTEAQYRSGLLALMETFDRHAAGAARVWATTTPMRDGDDLSRVSDRTERVDARNRIAAEIMRERGIAVNDLYGLVASHPEFYAGDGVHFNDVGRATQAAAVAESVLEQLPDSR